VTWLETDGKYVIDKAHMIVLPNSPSITNTKAYKDVVDPSSTAIVLHNSPSSMPFQILVARLAQVVERGADQFRIKDVRKRWVLQ
jgi:hypothetical protein